MHAARRIAGPIEVTMFHPMRSVVHCICGCLLSACGATTDYASQEIVDPAPESSAVAALDYAACNNISDAAHTELTKVQQSVAQCEVDSDCREFTLAGVCAYRCYPFVGNDGYKAAIETHLPAPFRLAAMTSTRGSARAFPWAVHRSRRRRCGAALKAFVRLVLNETGGYCVRVSVHPAGDTRLDLSARARITECSLADRISRCPRW